MRAINGPAAGVSMGLRTCPRWLRLVTRPADTRPSDGGTPAYDQIAGEQVLVDALDQADDTPAQDETVHVYRLVAGTWGVVYVRPGGRYEHGDYRHIGPGTGLRERDAWIAWVADQEGMTLEELAAANAEAGRNT
jgi:hypothetical protein